MFEAVVFGAGLAQVGNAGGAALCPGQEMVCLVVQGVVATAREWAPAVPEPEKVALGFRQPVAAPADFQRRPVPGSVRTR